MSHGKDVRFILSILIMSALFEGFFRNAQKSETSKSIQVSQKGIRPPIRGRVVDSSKNRMPCVVLEMPGIAMRASLETKSFHFSFGAFWHYDILSQRKIFGEMFILQIKKLRNLHTKVQKVGGFLKTWYQKNNHFVSYIINDHFGVELGVPPFKETASSQVHQRLPRREGPHRYCISPASVVHEDASHRPTARGRRGPVRNTGSKRMSVPRTVSTSAATSECVFCLLLRLTVSLTWYTCMKMYYRYINIYIYMCSPLTI